MLITRVCAYALLVSFITVACSADEPIPITDVPLDLYQLKKWGAHDYRLSQYRKKFRVAPGGGAIIETTLNPVGRIPLETEVLGDQVIMKQHWRDPDAKLSRMLIRYECRLDNVLSLEKIEVKYRGKTESTDTAQGQYNYDVLGMKRTGKWPAVTMTDAAMLRIVTILPRIEGASYMIPAWSRTPDLTVEDTRDDPLRCLGKQQVQVLGRKYECTKFACKRMEMWVSDDGLLVKAEVPGWWVLELEK